ncbi:MAG: hypothetical protein V4685_13155 [Bacteroidota bacterium]
MKFIGYLLIFLSISFQAKSQGSSIDTLAWRQRIFNEIKDYGYIDRYCYSVSEERLKADSLFKKMPLNTVIAYADEKNHTIKYFAFLRLMELDDSLAFEYLKVNINDTTYVSGSSACMNWSGKFNETIANEYKAFIGYKYNGQSFIVDHRAYIFTERNHKLRKKKLKEFNKLINDNKLNLKNI